MTPNRRRFAPCSPLLCLGFAALAAACGTEPPTAGNITVSVQSPNGVEGAAVLAIAGVRVTAATLATGAAFLGSGEPVRLVAVLEQPGDIVLTLEVSDVNASPTVELVEVADAENRLRESLAGYQVLVAPER